ncbi:hypothetical protein IHN32_04655 [Deinococcus sp. 14RED07]|uniref:hypothetical protein n=1 Tax=Deinococcus sp. 14RED07 TaxID=2745874 RepID=UPI001E2D7E7A|nr:hypothetical protein [Deinococcus sp. 14RED07]MCD0175238.1 hypothetical protein [Deinococcus sp. 14RED07]
MIPIAIPSPCEEALRGLAAGQDDLRRCIETLTPMLFALARRLHLPEELREAAVGDALSDIRQHCGQWPRTQLPAQVWVLAVAQRRFLSSRAA